MQHCQTCELLRQRDMGNAPLWDSIYRAQYWDVVHSYNTALPGWLVLVVRRHVASIADLTEGEAIELGQLIRKLSIILREIIDCVKTYVVQFAEHPEHPHVHFHIIPRMAAQPEDHKGPNIFKYLGVSEEERVTETEMNQIALQVQHRLLEM